MKCPNCGAELTEDTKFCSYCGGKIIKNESADAGTNKKQEYTSYTSEYKFAENSSENEQPKSGSYTYGYSEADSDAQRKPTKKKGFFDKKKTKIEEDDDEYDDSEYDDEQLENTPTVLDKAEEKIAASWNHLDLFGKILCVAIIVVTFLLITALYKVKVFPIVISLLQLGGLGVALLMHKGHIKCKFNWGKYVVLAASIIIIGLNFSSYSWQSSTLLQMFDNKKSETPYSAQNCVGKDKDAVENDFSTAGFYNIEQEAIEDLQMGDAEKYGEVDAVLINGVTDFKGNTKFKRSAKIIIQYHDFKKIPVPLSSEEIKNMDAESVLKAFEEANFFELSTDEKYDLDPDATAVEFENQISIDGTDTFEKGEKFSPKAGIELVTHRPYEKYTLKVVVDFIPNLLFNKYDVELNIDGHSEKLAHGKDAEFEYRLKQGDYTLTFTSAESSSIKDSADLTLNGDTEVCYKITISDEKVKVETRYIENKGAVGENQAMVPSSAINCTYKNYKDIEKLFKEAGFTNIKTAIVYDIYWGFTDEGDVASVTIDGKSDFNRGNIFEKDAEIIITYHMKEEDDPSKKQAADTTDAKNSDSSNQTTENQKKTSAVYYSTNDSNSVKNGNSGIYSYKNRGGNYDIYYIIDFDAGYVYYFCDGNGDSSCDRVKIESGDLNSVLIITYHDGSDTWSEGLHFKWKNQPDHLVMQDQNGFEYDFYWTDLDSALKLKNEKSVHNY